MLPLARYKRLVIKIGSALLVDHATGTLRAAWLASLAADISALRCEGADVIVVSSGAIALGRHVLKLPAGPLKLEESQAAASVGQIELARAWDEALQAHGHVTGQLLVTLDDTEERRRYLNVRATIATLLRMKAVPIINENDTVATAEIKYGDNDRLGARVATMAGADCLVLLSDIDGLYDAPPAQNPSAKHIPLVAVITPEIEKMAGTAGTAFSSGGMTTKIAAAKIAVAGGTVMVIAAGHAHNPLAAIDMGARATWFAAEGTPITARKKWISGHLKPRGVLILDAGAVRALQSGKSLLPAGVAKITGRFSRGDAVSLKDGDGTEIARGLVSYDVDEAQRIIGRQTSEIQVILGYPGRSAMVHRDDMVLMGDPV